MFILLRRAERPKGKIMEIFEVAQRQEFYASALDWFSSKWGIPRVEYEKSFEDMLKGGALPHWYIAVENGEIIGGCGLIQNDFVDRVDLFPYICALFVEPKARGHELGGKLLEFARRRAHTHGFEKAYLCTSHIGYYERYGFTHIATGHHPGGDTSRIYAADTLK